VSYRYTGPDTNPWIGIPGGASDIGVAADGWDSGASTWTAQRRQAYANDQVPPSAWSRSPPARTGRRQSRILPAGCRPATGVHCRYVAEWVATKVRWCLAADEDPGPYG
jgi:hypothetical protein